MNKRVTNEAEMDAIVPHMWVRESERDACGMIEREKVNNDKHYVIGLGILGSDIMIKTYTIKNLIAHLCAN